MTVGRQANGPVFCRWGADGLLVFDGHEIVVARSWSSSGSTYSVRGRRASFRIDRVRSFSLAAHPDGGMTLFIDCGRNDVRQFALLEADRDSFVAALEEAGAAVTRDAGPNPVHPLEDDATTPLIDVVTYKDARHYERDALVRAANGWTLSGQSQDASRTKIAGKIGTAAVTGGLTMSPLLGAASLLVPQRKPGAITVTWVKERSGAARGSSATQEPVAISGRADRHDGLADQLQRLADLHSTGALSDDEFAAAKARLLPS